MAANTLRRTIEAGYRTRSEADGGPVVLSGYAVRYEEPTVLYESEDYRFVETIKRGACRKAVEGGQDVRFLIDHNPTLILGRTKAGTLVLRDDPEGLYFEVALPNTQAARDLAENLRLGNISECSFAFRPRPGGEESRSRTEGGRTVYETDISDVDLFDASAVTYPAYPTTSVEIKSRCLDVEARCRAASKAAWLAARSERFTRIETARKARKGN